MRITASCVYLGMRARNKAAISSNPLATAPSNALAPALLRIPASAPRASSNSTHRVLSPDIRVTRAACTIVKAANGTIGTFEAPGAGTGAYQGTLSGGINDAGAIGGLHQGAVALSINTGGAVTGYYIDATNDFHGYVRAAGGAFTHVRGPGRRTSTNVTACSIRPPSKSNSPRLGPMSLVLPCNAKP
jgi:hypothetical protein